MENQELKELLNKLENIIKTIDFEKMKRTKKQFKEAVEEAFNESCKIIIEKNEDGTTKLGVEGNRLTLLMTLAGAEKGILNQLNCREEEFEFIKTFVGTEEVSQYE